MTLGKSIFYFFSSAAINEQTPAAGVKKGVIKKRSPDCGSLDFLAGLTRSPPEIRGPQITLLNLPGNGSLETLKSNFGLPSARPAAVRAVGENIRTVGDSRE